MSLWTDVPNKLAGDSNQQWNHYMSFKPPYAHSCILQQDGNILYLCVTVCFLRYKLIYLKSLKVSDLHPCLKRCSVRCDEARPCSVSLYSLMGLWGWRVCNEVIFIPRSLFASFVPYLKNVSQILAGAFNVNLNVVKVHSWTGTHSSRCDGAEVSSSSVFFFLLAYLYSWVYIITIYIYKRTQTQRVLCGCAPFVFLVAFTPARSMWKSALRDRICIATAITPVCGCERGWSPVSTFLLITVYSGKAAERLTFALRSLSATVWPPSNRRGFASSKMLRLWIRPHADHFHEFSYICLNCVSFL